jgi:uncharacterized membrane protein YccC
MTERSLRRRFAWLAGCLAAGLGIGFAGQQFTGEAAWFLAVPACLAAGWLVVANPEACLPERDKPGK